MGKLVWVSIGTKRAPINNTIVEDECVRYKSGGCLSRAHSLLTEVASQKDTIIQ